MTGRKSEFLGYFRQLAPEDQSMLASFVRFALDGEKADEGAFLCEAEPEKWGAEVLARGTWTGGCEATPRSLSSKIES